ncbi:hypothetical protein BJ875DRAFT_484018 [Amylocarpus encephaloides]|uniref:Uncharacterized protein n=1 Tax=Amylocarpus encephaloides TaxID=45428 RepID=A0A9P7YJC0_9HELO|nr:hypothetical protein BJ875DRAFT_484018 [Amylocarpus encephaloides]
MISLRSTPARKTAAVVCARCISSSPRTFTNQCRRSIAKLPSPTTPRPTHLRTSLPSTRTYATKSSADSLIEHIQDQYATAKDEFEIATEETEKKSVYGADDRVAAREELNRLKQMYDDAVEGESGEEVKRRVGARIRELDNAVQALERSAHED